MAATTPSEMLASSFQRRSSSQQSAPSEYISVAEFYAEKSIFVTGGTGFMGKVLVEKLLRSCPKIKNIFLLMRPKKGHDVSSRLSEITNSPLFEIIRRERPSELQKIVPIMGDVTEPDLGISTTDQAMLCQKVSIVFHSAATVKFDEKLKLSVMINMLGTKRLVELCHRMMNLEALIHVSTAYCNCDRQTVEEVIYPPPFEPDHVINLVQWMSEDLVDHVTPNLVGNRPNTYTFTKALAEDMLLKESGNLPVAIVRPSIVVSAVKEPIAGWVDNWNGPTGIIAAAGKGIFRSMLGDSSRTADLVPVDTVINLMIAAAWRTATRRKDTISVYNCCTGQQNPITWEKFISTCFFYMRKHPLGELFWYPGGMMRSSPFLHHLATALYQKIPAHIIDTCATLAGKKPMMVKVQSKLEKAAECLYYFTTQQWSFRDDNVKELAGLLSPSDRLSFDFDVANIHWDQFLEAYVIGIRRFIFKESPASIPKARQQLHRLHVYHRLSQFTLLLLAWRFMFFRSDRLKALWRNVVEFLIRLLRLLPIGYM